MVASAATTIGCGEDDGRLRTISRNASAARPSKTLSSTFSTVGWNPFSAPSWISVRVCSQSSSLEKSHRRTGTCVVVEI
ncbi:hypothetical protein C5C31_11180 [Rathayibacter rathayi]|nr:hypothetical protein C5C31_11180 [Rathayibacter rathayi]PPI76075.1 hypothetical protein C5E03_11595 [Rathayibacter rathayi]